jgi:hypothetical protein
MGFALATEELVVSLEMVQLPQASYRYFHYTHKQRLRQGPGCLLKRADRKHRSDKKWLPFSQKFAILAQMTEGGEGLWSKQKYGSP